MSETTSAYPEWTEYRKKTGLDPLGMQNSSVALYQRLLPGISNVTQRVRYYGFYAWLASIYTRRSGNTDLRNWQRFVRRAEALYALSAQVKGGEGGIAGIQWAQRALAASEDGTISFAQNADPGGEGPPYLQQPWGAYGAAYASQLFEIGVFAQAVGHNIPVPSAELGDALSSAFGTAIGDLADRFYAAIESASVSVTDLNAFASMTPSAIEIGSDERQLYQDMLFADGKLKRSDDVSRRQTLLLLLNCARHLERMPNVSAVRWLLYARMDEDDRGVAPLGTELEMQRSRWWTYHANDLLQVSYETLLKFCLEILEAYPDGIALTEVLQQAVGAISEVAPSWPSTWRSFRKETSPAQNAYGISEVSSERNLFELISKGLGSGKKTTAQAAWSALKVIAIVENRVEGARTTVEAERGQLGREGFHSLLTEIEFLAGKGDADFTETLVALLEQRVIKRHLWVAHRKFRYQGDYTFLIEADDGRIRQRAESGPVLTNPRLGPALTFLRDIHLLADDGVTDLGAQLLAVA